MADPHDDAAGGDRPGTGSIGVGMGGSCPECRAPVDLGQEFCLECGAPIRFTPRQRSRRQPAMARQRPGAPGMAMPPRRGFPWVPFVVLLLIVAVTGAVVLFASGDDDSGDEDPASATTTADTIPTVDNTVPTTTSSTSTVTLQDCDPSLQVGTSGTVDPADPFGSSSAGPAGTGGTLPELTDSTFDDQLPDSLGAVPDGSSDQPQDAETVVTVDENGTLCNFDTAPGGTDTGTPGDAGSGDGGTGGDDGSGADTWPVGASGYTVVLASLPSDRYTRSDAEARAADAQARGISGGVLVSDGFQGFQPGFWVVYSGRFADEQAAQVRRDEAESAGFAGSYVPDGKVTRQE